MSVVYDKRAVSEVFRYDDLVYCVVDKVNIITIDHDGENETAVLSLENPISEIIVDENLLFFSSGNSVYRYYIATKTLDKFYTNENFGKDDNYRFDPLSTTDFFWDDWSRSGVEGYSHQVAYSSLTDKEYEFVDYVINDLGFDTDNFLENIRNLYVARRAEDLKAMGINADDISTFNFTKNSKTSEEWLVEWGVTWPV